MRHSDGCTQQSAWSKGLPNSSNVAVTVQDLGSNGVSVHFHFLIYKTVVTLKRSLWILNDKIM